MESQELEDHLSRQITDIRDINESNIRVKKVMEQQLIDQRDGIGKIYSITKALDQRMPDEVMFYAVEILTELMGTRDVALYNVVNGDYARIFSAASPKARSLGNSIRYREMTEIYEELAEEKVYINKTMDERYPLDGPGHLSGGFHTDDYYVVGLKLGKNDSGAGQLPYRSQLFNSECGAQFPKIHAGTGRKAIQPGFQNSGEGSLCFPGTGL